MFIESLNDFDILIGYNVLGISTISENKLDLKITTYRLLFKIKIVVKCIIKCFWYEFNEIIYDSECHI